MKNLIRLIDIKKSYQIWEQKLDILKWINLEINEWDFMSVMGQSWSWKSTLMNIIGMLDSPSSWKFYFNWQDISDLDIDQQALIRRKNIWFVFQSYNLLKRTKTIEQVMMPLMYQGVWIKERKERAFQALKKVWLEDKIDSYPNEMSWWQQQRVAIARSIVTNPLLLLWDEPTWALDSNTWEEVMEILRDLNKEWKTILIITHAPEVDKYANKHVLIKDWLI